MKSFSLKVKDIKHILLDYLALNCSKQLLCKEMVTINLKDFTNKENF